MSKNLKKSQVEKSGSAKAGNDKYIGIFPLKFGEYNVVEGDDDAQIPSEIHLVPIGSWEHELYGTIIINASDIRQFVENFDAKIRKGVYITAGHEGFNELPAVGWIMKVYARDDGLWGTVDWNNLGIETLEDKQFKFFSPEFNRQYEDPESHQTYGNVLTGGALTKSPYFKELGAIVFSEPKITKQFNDSKMSLVLKDVLEKKVEELSAEETAFLIEHKAELTPEQATAFTSVLDVETPEQKEAREAKEKADKETADTKAKEDANVAAGLNPDGTAKEIAASEKTLSMSETEVKMLREKADKGAQAFAELEGIKLNGAVDALIFSESNKVGRLLPKAKEATKTFMATLNAAQRLQFAEILKSTVDHSKFTEAGVGIQATEGTAKAELEAKINQKLEANKGMKYSEALKAVMSENKGLEERYDSELPKARGGKN